MAKVPDPKQVKSAKRVLQVFEYFGASRQQATVMEIAREFGYPQSSTSELLGCLVELGFLRRDRHTRMYRPSARVAHWAFVDSVQKWTWRPDSCAARG